jgi:lysophospholipase L1-like esterase
MDSRRSPWPLIAAIGVTVAVGIGGLIAANGSAPADSSQSQPPVPTVQYVAVGDSFTAGGPIGALQAGSGSCQRSSRNYPSLVAKELRYALADVSCGGATTRHVLDGSRAVPTPQVAAINDETDVVTVSVGGNDLRIVADLLLTCFRVSRPDAVGAPCRDAAGQAVVRKVSEMKQRLGSVLDEVRERAPDAHILVVTYPGLLASDKTCGSTPFATRDISWFAGVEGTVAQAMAAAAEDRDIDVADVYGLSRGHDICSGADAWVNGARPKPHDGLLYHPNAAGEQAVAKAVADRLRNGRLN